jgi:hypothetical protein
MNVSKLVEIASKRYDGEIYDKEITLKAFPRDVRDNSDREATIFKLMVTEEVPVKLREFKDVKEDAWYYDIVTTTDYLEGTTKVTFSPDDPLTREMFIAALYNIAGTPIPKGNNEFNDIPKGSWAEDAIVWAGENDIMAGYQDGRFMPSKKITRQEAIVVLKKYAEPLLESVQPNEKEYAEAQRMLSFLRFFKKAEDDSYIANNSILREFIGGSVLIE